MRLVYFGSGAFGLPTLERLATQHEVVLVVTQPDRPAGRNQMLTATPIAQFAQARGMAVIRPENVNDAGVLQRVRSVEAEAMVVIAFGQKIGRAMREKALAINLHGSLLPKFRGAAPINWAMIYGESRTGVSVIELADRMDAGPVLGQVGTEIDPMETAGELYDRLARMGPELVIDVLRQHERGEMEPVAQDERLATRAPKLLKADGTVRFDQPAIKVRQRVHGLTPWPGCTVRLDGRVIRIGRVQTRENEAETSEPGVVLGDLTIGCAMGAIRILEVQPPGGKLMSFRDYCNGQPVRVGARCQPV